MSARELAEAFWLAAGRDKVTFEILAASEIAPLENMCFHAQQFLEKLMKCALSLRGASFPRTHDLVTLADLLIDAGSTVPVLADELDKLAPCGVLARYEGLSVGDIQRTELLTILASAHRWAEQLRLTYSLP